MTKSTIYFFLLLFIAFNIGFSQYQPALPPVPIPSDKEQIDVIIKTLTQALIGKNANQLKAIYNEINNTNISKNTQNEVLNINAIDIDQLRINRNIASAMCKIRNCKGELLREQQIIFEKHGFYWQIKEAPELIDTVSSIIFNYSSQQNTLQKEGDSKTLLTTPSILTSNNMLIKIPHPWTNNSQIDAGYTSNNIQRRLFSDDVRMDIDAAYLNLNPDDAISFHLDYYWDRIVYAQKSGNWIKSYGDHAGDYKFINPKGMAIDVRDTIFVADTDNGKIVKLFYNTAQISFVSSFSINGIIHPVDIDIDQSGTLLSYPNPQIDLIWIADDYSGKIVAINRAGEIKKTIEYYGIAGVGTLRLAHPLKVLAHSPSMIAFIDGDRMAFVTAAPPPTGGTVATAYYSTEFDKTTSDLTCIGQDLNNEWWVGDIKQKMYHKFTSNGAYLASYKLSDDPAQNFQSPVSITKAPYYNGLTPARCQYVYTSDLWGTNTGMRAFFPGVDALNISFIPYVELCYAGVKFILTNQAYVRGRLTLNNDTTTIAYYDYGVLPAGTQTLKIDKFKLKKSETYYKFTIELQPRYWSNYHVAGVEQWRYYSIDFLISMQTGWAASITPVPSDMKCFSSGSTGTWKITPTCPIGFYSYKWYRNSYVGDEIWGYLGPTLSPEISFITTTTSFELRCDVTHRDGDTKTAYYTNCPPYNPPPITSCPFVFTWDGAKFQEDNNILPPSEYTDNIGKDVTDYYRLRKILNVQNGKYVLQIREFENEKSYLDQFRLIAVDHPANTKIDVSATGEIYQYITPFALNRARMRGLDVTQNLSASDSNRIIVNPGDTLHISVLNLLAKNSRSLQTSVGGGEGDGSGLPKVDKMASVIQTRSSPSNPIGFTFRQRPTLVYTPMTLDSTNSLDIIWTQKARLDYFNFGVSVPQTYTSRELPLYSAVHSSNGDVTALLLKKDYSYSTLMPGSSIELCFNSIPGPSSNKKRTFILLSEGRYETIEDSSQNNRLNRSLQEVTSFKLDRNYPNPFNPVTRINFQLPVEGHTSLIIYDLLGREVARLIDGYIEKGYHSIEWDAGNNSSGLYFCRFTVSDGFGKELYSEIQKLLVMR